MHDSDTRTELRTAHDNGIASKELWTPRFLKWPYVLSLTIYSATAGFVLIALALYSKNHNGLSAEHTAVLGWRFIPTLLAVLYTQCTLMLFYDIKRTEPFARLAKLPKIELSRTEILKIPQQWWLVLRQGTQKAGRNRQNLPFLLSCIVHVLAFLAISPLSSLLLVPESVRTTRQVKLSRLAFNTNNKSPLNAATDRDTSFRIIGSILQENFTTSPWVKDGYVVFPFQPISSTSASWWEPRTPPAFQSWRSETLILRNEFDCERLDFQLNKVFQTDSDYDPDDIALSVFGATPKGCKYSLDFPLESGVHDVQFSSWSDSGTIVESTKRMINYSDLNEVSKEYGFVQAQLLLSDQCSGDETIIFSSRSVAHALRLTYNVPTTPGELMSGYVCSSRHTMANVIVSASISEARFDISFNKTEFEIRKRPVPETLLNLSRLHDIYTNPEIYASLATPYETDYWYLRHRKIPSSPLFGGMSALLASLYQYNWTAMVNDPNLPKMAAKVRARVFEETLRTSMSTSGSSQAEEVAGTIQQVEWRIVVVPSAAFAMATILLLSFMMLAVVLKESRISLRPLSLCHDPGSVLGLASVVANDPKFLPGPQELTNLMNSGSLKHIDKRKISQSNKLSWKKWTRRRSSAAYSALGDSERSSGRPKVFRLIFMTSLSVYIIGLLIAIAVMYRTSIEGGIYDKAFTYNVNMDLLGRYRSFAPFSIVPTLLAIALGLWWDVVDKNLRLYQPYASLASAPMRSSRSIGVSYRSTYWLWASLKALMNGHLILSFVASSSFMIPVFTISMSALFERELGTIQHIIPFERSLEMRHAPNVRLVPIYDLFFTSKPNYTEFYDGRPGLYGKPWTSGSLIDMYGGTSSNWIYSAIIEATSNTSTLSWSKDDWSFIPVDIDFASNESGLLQPDLQSSVNYTLETPAIRSGVTCTRILDIENQGTWLATVNMTGRDIIPSHFSTGYKVLRRMFQGTDHLTRASPSGANLSGIINEDDYNNGRPMHATFGSWTNNYLDATKTGSIRWPSGNFTVKWMQGIGGVAEDEYGPEFFFSQPPQLQALNCMPVIETAHAQITVDSQSGIVLSYTLITDPEPEAAAWSESFVIRNLSVGLDEYPWGPISQLSMANVTTSYGVLFISSILNAAGLEVLHRFPSLKRSLAVQDISEQGVFHFWNGRTGMDFDPMSYAAYLRNGQNASALLDAQTLLHSVQATLSLFFRHFVHMGMSTSNGGLAYQKIGEVLKDVGYPLPETTLPQIMPGGLSAVNISDLPPQKTDQLSNQATVSRHTEILRMNVVATWLCISILVWLLGSTILVAMLHRQYLALGSIIPDIEGIEELATVVLESRELLKLVRAHGVDNLNEDTNMRYRLCSVSGEDGQEKWKVEVVGHES